jgi:hypothetical protein
MRLVSHRIGAFATALALLICWAAIDGGSASAQGQPGTTAPGVWGSAINLQNVGSNSATPTITFYNANGEQVTQFSPSQPIAKNGALSLFVPAQVQKLSPGQYSAVVRSAEPFVASVNTASTNNATPPWTAFAYEGIGSSQAGATLFFPGLYKGYFSFDSEMVIQNAGTTTATLKADFYNAAGTKIATANLGTLARNAARTFPIATLVATPPLPGGNTAGLFGAVVTSTQGNIPLVGIANIWRTSPTNGTASYNASTTGSSVLYAPALLNNYFGFVTALTVQNVHPTQTANVRLTYSDGTFTDFALKPLAARQFYQPGDSRLPSGNTNGVFSAKVTTQGGSIVGLVSQSIVFGPPNGSFASYTMPRTAAPAVNISAVLHGYFGYFTAVTVQNTDPIRTTDIVITYANGKERRFQNVGPNRTVNILHLDSTPGEVLSNGTTISAVVKSVIPGTNQDDTVNLVAVIQHNTAPGVNGNDPSHVPSDYLLALTGSPRTNTAQDSIINLVSIRK